MQALAKAIEVYAATLGPKRVYEYATCPFLSSYWSIGIAWRLCGHRIVEADSYHGLVAVGQQRQIEGISKEEFHFLNFVANNADTKVQMFLNAIPESVVAYESNYQFTVKVSSLLAASPPVKGKTEV